MGKLYYKGQSHGNLSDEAQKGEKAMARALFRVEDKQRIESHPLKPYSMNGRKFIDMERGRGIVDQVEVDLLEGNATEIGEKLRRKLEESLRNKDEQEVQSEHEGETGEDIAEAEKLIEELINKITTWLEEQFYNHALLIKNPEEINNINERGDINLCVTPEFMNFLEENLPKAQYQFEQINEFAKKLEFNLLNGEKFKIVFVGKANFETEERAVA